MGFWDAVASAGPYANNLNLAPDNHTNTSSLIFFRLTNGVKALKAIHRQLHTALS